MLLGATYVLFGLVAYHQYETAKQTIQDSEQQVAASELEAAIHCTIAILQEEAERFIQWDELYQQLYSPTYFSYWYAHRIRSNPEKQAYFEDLMVYDAEGNALAVFEGNSLPRSMETSGAQDRYLPAGKDVRVILMRPLRRAGATKVEGYLALSARLLPNIRRRHLFNRIASQTLYFVLQEPTTRVADLVAAARFDLRQTLTMQAMDELVLRLILLLGVLVLLPTMILMYFFMHVVGRNVQHVPEVVAALRKGESPHLSVLEGSVLKIRELEMVEQSLLDYHRELSQVNDALDEKNRELWNLAHLDALTGAQNRRAFEHFWNTLQSLAERDQRSMRLMLCDVNHFKAINDTYGHDVGDAVLQAIVRCLQRALRRGEQLFRLGGDEFVCVLLDCDDRQAMAVAARCAREVSRYPFREELGIKEPVRLSIGISPATDDPTTPLNVLLRQADVAMYHSKRPSTGAVTIYRESLDSETGPVFSSSANEAVYRAIEKGEGLCLYYQPVRSLDDEHISYYEALLRIQHGDEVLMPADILPVVESRRLERELDQAVMDELLRALYSGVIPAGTGVPINLSALSISGSGIVSALEPFRPFLSDIRIVIEVTETALITSMEEASSNLMHLRNQGFLVALDDFGSGYSSLRYLTTMPVDIVKFDISLIRALGQEAQFRLVSHLVDFISDTGQRTVAEGVEDEQVLQQVRAAGFACMQGFLVGRPQPLRPRGVSEKSASADVPPDAT